MGMGFKGRTINQFEIVLQKMTTSAVTGWVSEVVKPSETERKKKSNLMEQILSSDNLNRAYLQVVRNKGAEGWTGMKYTELKEHLAKNGESSRTVEDKKI